MTMAQQNPYVGARTFEREEKDLFFGRERETFDLLSLVVSDRLVLFYAQSGAGKSSLINTRLIPGLDEEGDFIILPTARLRRDEVAGSAADNIYVYNLLTSISKNQMDDAVLTKKSLTAYFKHLDFNEKSGYFYNEKSEANIFTKDASESCKYVLIIDQFEELFTTYEEEWQKREDFFKQLAAAMKEFPRLWVVLVMREDYIAQLDPYVYLLPGRLRTRYYMQRLSTGQAIEAVEGPAKTHGKKYAEGAANTLVDALSQVNVREPDNTWGTRSGQYVEPVQLQVVCSSLWQKLGEDSDVISNELVAKHVKNINQALGDFYEQRVEQVAGGTKAKSKGIKERDIRSWFETELIIDGKRRNMVAQEPGGKSGGLDDGVVQELVRLSLVREEKRGGGATFYELTHDRMVEPIIENNRAWDLKIRSPFRSQVDNWETNEKKNIYLISDQALIDARQWAKDNPEKLTESESKFLEACKIHQEELERELERQKEKEQREREFKQKELEAAQKLAEEKTRSAKRSRIYTYIAAGLALVALIAAILAFTSSVQAGQQKSRAEQIAKTAVAAQSESDRNAEKFRKAQIQSDQNALKASAAQATAESSAKEALAGNLVGQANANINKDHALALLLAAQAYKLDPESELSKSTLFTVLQFTPHKVSAPFAGVVNSVAVSPDGKFIAIASCKKQNCRNLGDVRLFNEKMEMIGDAPLPGEYGIVNSLAFTEGKNGLVLAAGGCGPAGCSVDQGQISLWNIDDAGTISQPKQIKAHNNLIKIVEFNADGSLLASGSYDTTIYLWDANNLAKPVAGPLDQESFVNDITFSPDGNYLVSAGDDQAIYIWDISSYEADGPQLIQKITEGQTAPVTSVAFSPDGKKLASAGYDSEVRLWDWSAGSEDLLQPDKTFGVDQNGNPLEGQGHTGYVTSLDFLTNESLASAGFDSKVILWDVNTGEQIGPALDVHTKAINEITFGTYSSNGSDYPYLVSGSNDRTAIEWYLFTRNPISPISDYQILKEADKNANEWRVKVCEAAKTNLTQDQWNRYLPGLPFEQVCP